MNKCLIELLDPQGKVRVPAKAYLCVSSTEGIRIPNCRVYAANFDVGEMALMLWSAEQAIKNCCEQIPGLRKIIDGAHEFLDDSLDVMFDTTTIMYRPESSDDGDTDDDSET